MDLAAVLRAAQPGAVVCLTAGSYGQLDLTGILKSGMVTVQSASGTATASLSLKNTIDEDPKLKAQTNNLTFRNLTIAGADLIRATNLNVIGNRFTDGVSLRASTAVPDANLWFDRNTFDNLGPAIWEGRFSIRGYGNRQPVGIKLTNNHFGDSAGHESSSDGVQIIGGAYGVQVGPGNEFEGIVQPQGANKAHTDPIQSYGSTHTVITGNYFHDNSTTLMFNDEGDNYTITDNVMASPGYPNPIAGDKWGGKNVIAHNTILGKDWGGGNVGIALGARGAGGTVEIRDNILVRAVSDPGGVATVTSNLFVNEVSGSNIAGTPTFVGGASPKTWAGFALAAGSVGVGKASDGKNMGVTSFGK